MITKGIRQDYDVMKEKYNSYKRKVKPRIPSVIQNSKKIKKSITLCTMEGLPAYQVFPDGMFREFEYEEFYSPP